MIIALIRHELTLLLICMSTACLEFVLSYIFGMIRREGNYYSSEAGVRVFIFAMNISNQSIATADCFNTP